MDLSALKAAQWLQQGDWPLYNGQRLKVTAEITVSLCTRNKEKQHRSGIIYLYCAHFDLTFSVHKMSEIVNQSLE